MRQPQQLTDIAAQARIIVKAATNDLGPDLGGHSVVDLVLDHIDCSSEDAKAALVIAGVDHLLSRRLVRSYSSASVPCDLCGQPTAAYRTGLCDRCNDDILGHE